MLQIQALVYIAIWIGNRFVVFLSDESCSASTADWGRTFDKRPPDDQGVI